MDEKAVYTIGYSTHELTDFLALLSRHAITAVADVRSHPTARLEPYRQANLRAHLRDAGLAYVFLGRELGARREEPACYVDGQAVYDRVATLPAFQEGLARLERGSSEHRIALLCAEREPLDCHRGVLIAPQLVSRGWRVHHILADGLAEEHHQTERRLVRLMGADPLFDTRLSEQQLVRRALRERAGQIAYRKTSG